MATSFDQWEKDPFFPAAEEVQDSADRMESVYRQWIHERNDVSNPENGISELLRELHTVLGTAKWQLDELNRAVRSSDNACPAGEETRMRHSQFLQAIGNQILMVETSLKEANNENGESEHSWVRLDRRERDELAIFLSCPLPPLDCHTSGRRSSEMPKRELKAVRGSGHRRTASACADTGPWKITVQSDHQGPSVPPPKIPSFPCLSNDLESSSKGRWPHNIFRKLKGGDQHQLDDLESINPQLSRGCNACYEKTIGCCGHETDDKQLYGWFGAFQRQFQRSQYQIRYGRSFQMISMAVSVVLLIVFLSFRTI